VCAASAGAVAAGRSFRAGATSPLQAVMKTNLCRIHCLALLFCLSGAGSLVAADPEVVALKETVKSGFKEWMFNLSARAKEADVSPEDVRALKHVRGPDGLLPNNEQVREMIRNSNAERYKFLGKLGKGFFDVWKYGETGYKIYNKLDQGDVMGAQM